MRIIGGKAAGRIISAPRGLGVRPTPDKVRQAIFNSLGERVRDARVLELFGGSGALGLEALSRSAQWVTCVEKSRKHARFILANLAEVEPDSRSFNVIVSDALRVVSQLRQQQSLFDLIMADPPFGEKTGQSRSKSFSQLLLDHEDLPHLLESSGLFVLGHAKRDRVELPNHWTERKCLQHGDSIFRMLETSREYPLLAPAP